MTLVMFGHLFDALARYADHCGGYPGTLAPLEAPAVGALNCEHLGAFAEAIRAEGQYKDGDSLGMCNFSVGQLRVLRDTGVYHGYRFQYIARDRQPNGLFRSYSLSADP